MLDVDGLGAHRVSVSGGRARVDAATDSDDADFRLRADPRTLVDLVTAHTGHSAS